MTEVTHARALPKRLLLVVLALLVLLGALITVILNLSRSSGLRSRLGPEGVLVYQIPDLALASTTRTGQPVDNISCVTQAKEIVKYHVHVHVTIYVNGVEMRLPAGIGITNPQLTAIYPTGEFIDAGPFDCLYWLHTHVADGIIHVEAPNKQFFTLGDFFDIWGQPLEPRDVGSAQGRVVVFENGKRLAGDPHSTPLIANGNIQIDVGSPLVSYRAFHFKVTGGCGQGTLSCTLPTG